MEREGGGLFTKTFFCILIIGLLIYSGINLGKPWFRYYTFKDRLKEISMYDADEPREKTMKKIIETAEEKGIPVGEEDIKIEQMGKRLIIKTEWEEEVQLFGGRIRKVWHFSVDTGSEKKTNRVRVL